MNNYDKLINKLQRKHHNYIQELDNYTRAKDKLTQTINEKDNQKEEYNKELARKKAIISELKTADLEITKQETEHKTLVKFGIFLGCIFGIAAFTIASNYTSAFIPKIITAIITTLITSAISIGADTYRKNKTIKSLTDFQQQHNLQEIEEAVNNLNELIFAIEAKRNEYTGRLTKKKDHISFLTKAIAQTYKLIENAIQAKDFAIAETHSANEQELNNKYQNDTKIEEILSLSRKKPQNSINNLRKEKNK